MPFIHQPSPLSLSNLSPSHSHFLSAQWIHTSPTLPSMLPLPTGSHLCSRTKNTVHLNSWTNTPHTSSLLTHQTLLNLLPLHHSRAHCLHPAQRRPPSWRSQSSLMALNASTPTPPTQKMNLGAKGVYQVTRTPLRFRKSCAFVVSPSDQLTCAILVVDPFCI